MVRDLTTFVMVDPAKLGGLSNVNFLAFAKVFTLQSWIAFFSLSILCAVGYGFVIPVRHGALSNELFFNILDS